MLIADAHLHLFRNGFPGVYGRSLTGSDVDVYEAFRDRHGIAAGLVVGYEGHGIDPGNNAYIRELAATRPWMTTLAYVAPEAMPTGRHVGELMAAGHAGLSVYLPSDDAVSTLAAWGAEPWRTLDDNAAVVSFNVGLRQVAALSEIAEAVPRCRILISHMGLPGACRDVPSALDASALLEPLTALARHRNVHVKLSGFYAVSEPAHDWPHRSAAPFVTALLDTFGPERCLWGSDFAPVLDHVSFVQSATVPGLENHDDAVHAAVMGGNLLRLLGRA